MSKAGDTFKVVTTADSKIPKKDLPEEAYGYMIKHTQGFKHFGYHLSIYLYFRNLSEKKGNFTPTKRFPFQVIDKDVVPLTEFKKFCLNDLKIAPKHYVDIIKHGNIFHIKRTMKLNYPDTQPVDTINKHYAKLWEQLKINRI